MQGNTTKKQIGNRHLFYGETVPFATRHGKEKILHPLLSELAIGCLRADVETDRFGTFTGEVERTQLA